MFYDKKKRTKRKKTIFGSAPLKKHLTIWKTKKWGLWPKVLRRWGGKGEHGAGIVVVFFCRPLTLLEVERRAIPIGRKTMPISTKVPTTQLGVRMGCHAFKRCCLKGLSLGLFVAVDSDIANLGQTKKFYLISRGYLSHGFGDEWFID